ncbi:LANO_0B03928g1_1 [Lachancea nothofagi CBS 11611]|uniref:LANO_0B03928g1_1 n=1 Tax=Lachancea nothofagi CBS 11611 TaxID=1266666 RepID=A0A1G4IX57_9SACH|nr:LANO_0B03928g1_1 [Lachancea nothofagi CBS 11611]
MLRIAPRSAFKRTLASHAKPQVTELSNGLRVATHSNDQASSATVGVVFGSGSTAENPYNNGVSSIVANLVKSEGALPAAKAGVQLSTLVGRDSQSFLASYASGSGLNKTLDVLQSQIANALGTASDSAFTQAAQQTLKESELFELNNHAGRVSEHLHATAFQNTPLALPMRGTAEAIQGLEKGDIQSFALNHFRNSNAVIVGSGNLAHDELVKAVESQLSLESGEKPVQKKTSTFLGSEVRLRDDTLPKAWISIAVEGESVTSPDYYVAQVAAEVFGSFNAAEPASRLQGIKLLDQIQDYHLCDSYNHFSLSYKDSGLWGFAAEISNTHQIDDLTHFTLKQWNRLTISVTGQEVARAKSLLKLKLGGAAMDNVSIANTLGTKTLALGAAPDLTQVFEKIDAITVKDVKSWASSRLWDQDIAISGTGQIESLLDYMRLRNDMSMMRW